MVENSITRVDTNRHEVSMTVLAAIISYVTCYYEAIENSLKLCHHRCGTKAQSCPNNLLPDHWCHKPLILYQV
jgi:hypothetical protein